MRKPNFLDKFSRKATYWIGTTCCLVVHTLLFLTAFILVPLIGFDRIMLVVTTIVSLEAIYLSIFIQMSVNRQHARIRDIAEDIDDILEDTSELTEEQKEIVKAKLKAA